ncbi:uncharacterized protein LOC122016138 [Zingiber officinale]|uniref:Protein kinase domain-containing protein n=1 Tax=Zingiber officinale TaxID=94328 RepID=A0A8J5F6Q7_ZINOF|nr:uncharacterized protein LOC122016138 [Zingiber officinale]XP_042429288.1 uncharacterized protein LOC122016138 [Zingiber officinale]KAG6483927.1 hypothetical protein ZIOFF_060713 [Zingiber officinale]
MDARKVDGSANQRSTQFLPSSSNANVRPPEASASSGVLPVLNFSIQTGEEFALEFMRDRAFFKKPTVQSASGNQDVVSSYMGTMGVTIPHTGSESVADVSMNVISDNQQMKGTEKNNLSETDNKGHYASARSIPRVSSGHGSGQTVAPGYTSSESSDFSTKGMKYLCSFGGKILPRPSDGRLRYVGGDTRIISIKRGISWNELMQKTMAIYNRPHTIKYQLPGEELDALISVSCNEDLQNMVEEYTFLEGGEGSQKLRMFLFTSDDTDDVHFSSGSREGDSDVQFIAAVNGMDFGSRNSSYQHGMASTSASDLDQLFNLNVEAERANADSSRMQSIGFDTSQAVSSRNFFPSGEAKSSSDYNRHSQNFEDHIFHYVEGERYAYHINPYDRYENANSTISIPLPVPSDYGSNYTASVSVQPGQSFYQGTMQSPYSAMSSFDADTLLKNEKLASIGFSQKKVESGRINPHSTEPAVNSQQLDAPLHSDVPKIVSAAEILTSVQPAQNKGKSVETVPVLSSANTVNDGQGAKMNEDELCSSGALTSGFSDYEVDTTDVSCTDPPSRPFRVYQSERLPREQKKFLNRLSKSDDNINSHFMINQPCSITTQESIAESADPLLEGELSSQAENSMSSGKPQHLGNATVEEILHFEKHKKGEDTINQDNIFEPVTIQKESETINYSSQPMNSLITNKWHDQNEAVASTVLVAPHQANAISDLKGFKQVTKMQKSQSQHVPSKSEYEKPNVIEDTIVQESKLSRYKEKTIDGEAEMTKINIQDQDTDGHYSRAQEDPSVLPDIQQEEISNNSYNSNLVDHKPAFSWVESAGGTVFQKDMSVPTADRSDILIDINDRFPPNLLNDIFNKARIAGDLPSITNLRKDDTGFSVNMQNHEPKNWSFFRNLAQDEFKQKEFSLIDQDHVDYSSLLAGVGGGISIPPFQLTPLGNEKVDFGDSDFPEEMEETSVAKSNILQPGYVPSQIPHQLGKDKEQLQASHAENEESKFEGGEVVETVVDTFMQDVDLSNVQIITNEDLEELRELGSGTYGTVYHGKWRGTDVAIKRIKKSCFAGRSSEQERLTIEFWREAEILSQLHHPNVVAFYGVVKDGPGGTLATVTEFMVNGSLRHVLLRKDKYLDRRKRLIIAMDAAFGMEYLHSKNIVHFDLKCDNLLVNLKDQSRPICKVGDFGLSKIKRNTLVSGGVRGTLPWMAPELLNGSSNKVSEKVDVFSFGIVMWEILTGEEPYANMHYGAIIGGIVNNTLRPPVPATCDPEWRKLMEQCWSPDPAQRPSFTQITSSLRSMATATQPKLVK